MMKTGPINDDFSYIRSQILVQEPLPHLANIFNMVLQEEDHKGMMIQRENKSEATVVFAVNTSKVACNSNRPTCTQCGKTGHEESNCFEFINYPANWSVRGGGHGRGRSQCGRGGSRTTTGRGRGAATYAAQALAEEDRCDSSTSHKPGLSSEQIEKLLSLIEVPKLGCDKLSGKSEWLLDSGASYHMTGDINSLSASVAKNAFL